MRLAWSLTRTIDRALVESPTAISRSLRLGLLVVAPLVAATLAAPLLGFGAYDYRPLFVGLIGSAAMAAWIGFRFWKVAGAFSTRVSERRYRPKQQEQRHGR